MTTVDPALRFEILDLVTRYATAIDTRDWVLFRSTFTADADVDYGFAKWSDADSFTKFMQENHDPAGMSLHRMSNTVITGVDPLAARTYGDALILSPDNSKGTVSNAWYDDEFVRTEERGLRISRRHLRMTSLIETGPNQAPLG
ncbi:nuclear transport factor 2 family protein [Amycolatopsis jejuensis]|uniref:nuclear transport factor 2 family protein n=1 Tax=Amycolatopsis jejuensis TaxID=330084 RepID=UPI0006910CE2|nr:nuclear transport factor 2 family protein [Amycolatopsis jejuensis]